MKIYNYTPHVITIVVDGVKVELPSVGIIRATQVDMKIGEIETNLDLGNSSSGFTIPVLTSSFGAPEGVPQLEDDAVYIVSSLAAQSLKRAGYDMSRFLVPSGTIRDEQGRIIGCKGLAII